MVSDKVKSYDPAQDDQEHKEFDTDEKVGFFDLCFRYASCGDRIMFGVAWTASMIFGAALPGFCLIFGEMIDSVGANAGFDSLGTQAKYMIFIGLGVYVVSFLQISLFSVYAESIAYKIKIKYFESCLQKDAAFYDEDKHNPAEMSARIAKETSAIQRGIGDKIGFCLMSVCSFFFGFMFAFYWGWMLTLILLAGFPVMSLMGIGMAVSM